MSVPMLIAALLLWALAILFTLRAVAFWQASADRPRPGSRLGWLATTPTVVGSARSAVPFASGAVSLALMFSSFVTWDLDDGPSSPFWGYIFMAGLLLLVLSYLFFALTHWFNRPRLLVPPFLRSNQGKLTTRTNKRCDGNA